MEMDIFEVLKKCVKEYNKYHSPEAKVEIINFNGSKAILKKENVVEIKLINKGSLKNFVKKIKKVIKNKKIKEIVEKRVREFEKIGKGSEERIFSELCFCILTANFNAERAIKIQNEIGSGFLKFDEKKLSKKLKELGYRYPNTRAKYIVEARKKLKKIIEVLKDKGKNEIEKREWLVKNIKGLGYKEASHFLRNIGYKNLAILDFHIVDLLVKQDLLEEKPKTLNKKKYLEIEKILRKIAYGLGITLAELDLYLWYIETGKVLK